MKIIIIIVQFWYDDLDPLGTLICNLRCSENWNSENYTESIFSFSFSRQNTSLDLIILDSEKLLWYHTNSQMQQRAASYS